MTHRRTNLLTRPYDDHVPAPLLRGIVERRQSPTGVCHTVPEVRRAGRRCYAYPWSKMLLGDFFVVAIGDRSEQALRTAFAQAAARFDFELAVVKLKDDYDQPALRVTLTVIGVTQWKKAAEKAGVSVAYSDGRWKARKRRWEEANRKRPDKPAPPAEGKRKDKPFWKDNDPELPIPGSSTGPNLGPVVAVEPEVKLTREQMLKRALAGEEGA